MSANINPLINLSINPDKCPDDMAEIACFPVKFCDENKTTIDLVFIR